MFSLPNGDLMSVPLAIFSVVVIFWLRLSSGLRWWTVDLAWLSITMCLVLLKHVSAVGGWGLGARGFLGIARSILAVRRQSSVSQPGIVGACGRATVYVITVCNKYRCRHLSHSPSPSIAGPPFSSSSIPHISFPRLLLCNELPLFTS